MISQVAALRAFAESGEDAPAVQFPPIENVIEWPAFFGDGQFWAFNKISLICLIALAVPTILFLMAGRGSAENPSKLRVIAEGIIGFVEEQIAKPGIGHGYEPYVPLLTAFFMFIAIGNLFEVIPFFQMPMNARMGPPLVLALIAWAMFMAVGLKHNGFSYITGVVWPKSIENPAMRAFVGFIEFFSTFIVRPFSHAVRLFANMLAGHILLITFSVLVIATFKLAPIKMLGFVGAFPGLVAFTAFEVGVSFIQGFVFAILAAVYIGTSLHPEH